MSDIATDAGREYLEGMYAAASGALDALLVTAKGNQFEVSERIGALLAVHDAQQALLWRTAIRKTRVNTAPLDGMITPAIELLRRLRSQILTLGIDSQSKRDIEFALGEVYSGSDGQGKELNLDLDLAEA